MEKQKITGNEPATGFFVAGDDKAGWQSESYSGLTIRQHFAAMAMQAILSYSKDTVSRTAANAVLAADELIAALNK